MLERNIKILATIYTALLMGIVFYGLVFAGFQMKSPTIKGKVIQATMVDISQIQSRNKPKKVKKQTPPKKEPVKKDPPKKEPIKKEPIKKEPVKQTPPKKDPPRIIKKTPEVDTKALEAERKKDQERKKKLDNIKKKRKEAEERAKQAEQELNDLINKVKDKEVETIDPIQDFGTENGQKEANEKMKIMAQYQLAVIAAVTRKWNKPPSANEGLVCYVKVTQIPGGGVIDATISSPCNANTIVKNSIIAAIKKADPLPYKGFESVFSRTSTILFKPSGD